MHPVRTPADATHGRFLASIDPDNATREANRTNNAGATSAYTTVYPLLETVAFDLPSGFGPDGVLGPLTLRLRNPSFAAPSPATEVRFGGTLRRDGRSASPWGGTPESSIPIPALAPRQTYTVRFGVLADRSRCDNRVYRHPSASVRANIDPESHTRWNSGRRDTPESPGIPRQDCP